MTRLFFAVLLFTVVGCARTQKPEVATAVTPKPQPQLEAQPVSPPEPKADPWAELREALSSDTVLFDFNSDHLKPEGQQALQRVAGVLRKHHSLVIRVEGNCDERGTEEYNLMLGQRRAAVAKKYLTDLGVSDQQVETVSYGDLRPAVHGHTEEAYAKNRRDEIVAPQ